MIQFDEMIRQSARYLEKNRRCPKHHVEHIGSLTYALDFYSYLGDIERGRALMEHLTAQIVSNGAGKVFYPGSLNPMNMSNSVIDTGAAVDTMARFLSAHRAAFSPEEERRYARALREVVDTYLAGAAGDKPITNQRLWGLTGLASFARYSGDVDRYRTVFARSIERAFGDMTPDGFFRYYPDAVAHGAPASYDGITTFYQSRHIAFIRYVLSTTGISPDLYAEDLDTAENALLSMYTAQGIKDLRLECKRWYWLSSYEVASHGFDAYALACSDHSAAPAALHNVIFQIRRHFFDGYLHSHIGPAINFQCPIFWTAHVAWLTRIPRIVERFDAAQSLMPFTYLFIGREVLSHTTPEGRRVLNARWQERSPSTGIYENGLPEQGIWTWQLPELPPRLLFSGRETLNHAWYALRGGCIRETFLRVWYFVRECLVMLLPRYVVGYGRVVAFTVQRENTCTAVAVQVIPATKYGTMMHRKPVTIMHDI